MTDLRKTSVLAGFAAVLAATATVASYAQQPRVAQNAVTEASSSAHWKDDDIEWRPCPPIFKKKGCEFAVLHGDPAGPNVDLFFKVPKNYDIPWHRHTSAERMILVNGRLEITYEGEKPVVLNEGDYAYGPANKPHNAYCAKGPCVLFIALEEPMDALPVAASE